MGDIVIKDRDALQTVISTLTTLRQDIDAQIGKHTTVTDAAAAVMSAGVVAQGSSTGGVAPIYTDVMANLDTAVGKLASRASDASTALNSAIAELKRVLDGQTAIDAEAASQVAAT